MRFFFLLFRCQAQLRRGNESLVQGLVSQAEPFPWESKHAAPAGNSTAAAAAAAAAAIAAAVTTPEDSAAAAVAAGHGRHLSLHLDANAHRSNSAAGADPDADTEEDESTAPDFKGFVVPVETSAPEAVGVPAADDSAFLTRGHALRRRVSLEGVTVQNLEGPDLEAGEAGAGTVSLPWAGDATGDIGFIVSVPGEVRYNRYAVARGVGGVEELVFAVPEGTKSASAYTGSGGGIFGDCCGGGGGGGGEYADSVDDDGGGGAGGMLGDSDDEEDYNCLHGGILSGCLPEASRTCFWCCWLHGRTGGQRALFCLPTEMPSDIQSVRVTTEVVTEKEGEEPTLAVHVIVDRSVPVLGWVLMVSALFGLAAMAPLGDLLSKMSPDALPAIYPVWRYCCSTIIYSPWFLLMVAGSNPYTSWRSWACFSPWSGASCRPWGRRVETTALTQARKTKKRCLKHQHRMRVLVLLPCVPPDVSDAVAGTSVVVVAGDAESSGGQAFGILLGLGSACFGGMYILNAKSARNKVEVSHFAFIASIVPAALCTVVLLAAYGGSPEGRVLLFGTSGLFGWTQSPALVLVQVVTSVLGDMVGNFGFYLLLKYISPLVVSLASLTVPLLAVVEGLMLGVVSPPGILFGIGASLILTGAGTASMVTLLPHTEVFDATEAVKTTQEGVGDADKSPVPGSSLTNSPALGYGSVNGRGGGGGKATSRGESHNGELRPLLSLEAEDKKAESGSSEQPSLLFK
ncbi:unnamed protein product [Ectocarpus sp. CCAP 1310/34]|nr:unnamed protein product [Ectocarpus sp. CCAP 1310/34]